MKKIKNLLWVSAMTILIFTSQNAFGQISGEFEEGVRIGNSTTTEDGVIRFTGTDFEGYFNAMWNSLTAGGGGGGAWTVSGSDIYYNAGNVGIGTTMPTQPLEVNGTTLLSMNSTSGTPHLRLYEDDSSSGGSTRIEFTHRDAAGDKFELRAFVDDVTDQRIGYYFNSDFLFGYNHGLGGFGINTSYPSDRLDIHLTGAGGVTVDGDGTGDVRFQLNNDGGNHYIFDDFNDTNALKVESANDFAINTGGVNERMRINDNGEMAYNAAISASRQVNIATSDHLYALEADNNETGTAVGLGGEVTSTGATNKFGVFGNTTGSAGTGTVCGVYGTSSTTPASSYAVYANGDLFYSGALETPSDVKLKQNIQPIDSVLDKLMEVEVRTYDYKHDAYPGINFARGNQKGFIAQELQTVFPEMVESRKMAINGEVVPEENIEVLGINQLQLIPVLTKAIQEQQVMIDALRAELDELKSER